MQNFRALGALPPDPRTQPPHCEFLATRLVSALELHFNGTEAVIFFGAQSSLGGHNSCLRAQAVIWRAQLRNAPLATGLLQVYRNLSNCNYRIFVKEILLEIGLIEEMRTI